MKVSKLKVYNNETFGNIPQLRNFNEKQLHEIQVVSSIFPFKVNQYIIDELIDWNNHENDPIYQLIFPQKDMLLPEQFNAISHCLKQSNDKSELTMLTSIIRKELNPHPSSQRELNIPQAGDRKISGMQHKYRETVLFFPTQGQTCFSYCTFCFRWAQFIGDRELQFASKDISELSEYLISHPDLTDVLFTGGDPMVMSTRIFTKYLEALLKPELGHIQNIRIGTKSLAHWPHRFVDHDDADELLRLFERLSNAGKHVAVMAHYNHWRELDTKIARRAIQRLRNSGVIVRSQSPVVAHINDSSDVWIRLWNEQVNLGIIPYYMFVERDTGPKHYFEVPLEKTWHIYRDAIKQVSGLARTVRGPSMSTSYGKIEIQGITEIFGQKVFVLRFIQGRNPEWVQKPFFAEYDAKAVWFDNLKPAFGELKFFFANY